MNDDSIKSPTKETPPKGTPTPAAPPKHPIKLRHRTFRDIQGRRIAKSKHNGACPGAFGRQGPRRGGAVQATSESLSSALMSQLQGKVSS